MIEEYLRWFSPNLSRDFEMLTFGHSGYPIILFPTSQGRYYENKDFQLINSVQHFIEDGLVKIFCPDSIDSLSWYNHTVPPAVRVKNHQSYERMLLDEVVPKALFETDKDKVVVAGCSFGGYHAANFAFKHPELVSHLFSMSGVFDIRNQLDGFYNDDVYFNNPVDFLPDANNTELWNLKIVLGSAERDVCRYDNENLSSILYHKGMSHWLDVRHDTDHDWVVWREQFPCYLGKLYY